MQCVINFIYVCMYVSVHCALVYAAGCYLDWRIVSNRLTIDWDRNGRLLCTTSYATVTAGSAELGRQWPAISVSASTVRCLLPSLLTTGFIGCATRPVNHGIHVDTNTAQYWGILRVCTCFQLQTILSSRPTSNDLFIIYDIRNVKNAIEIIVKFGRTSG